MGGHVPGVVVPDAGRDGQPWDGNRNRDGLPPRVLAPLGPVEHRPGEHEGQDRQRLPREEPGAIEGEQGQPDHRGQGRPHQARHAVQGNRDRQSGQHDQVGGERDDTRAQQVGGEVGLRQQAAQRG
jgi:hypothetical protein